MRTRDPVDPFAGAAQGGTTTSLSISRELPCPTCSLGPPAALLETSKRKCAAATSSERYEEKVCMPQTCNGTERCIDDKDVILAIDGSASLSETGFKALRNFAAGLVQRYKAPHNVGVLQFGNGDLSADGVTISAALKISDFGKDVFTTAAAVNGLKHLSGLPNIPQALELADSMFSNSRAGVEKTLLVITNSNALYRHKAFEQAAKLRGKGIRIFVVAASDSLLANDFQKLKEMASRPIEANFFHIDALTGPKADPMSHLPTVLGHTCRKVERSP